MFALRALAAAVAATVLCGFEDVETPWQAVELGNVAYVEERYRDAADLYELALDALPDAPEVAFNRGAALFKLHELKAARAAFVRAIDTDDRRLAARAHYNLGNVQYRVAINAMRTFRDAVSPIREAMRSYREALALDPDLADAMYNLELADRMHDELRRQRMQGIQNPEAVDVTPSQNQGQAFDERSDSDRSRESEDAADQGLEPEGAQGEQAPQGAPSQSDSAQTQAGGAQREMTAEQAQETVDLARDRAQAAEALRQQWRQARMRESGAAKPW